jgi:hypothetical protein
MKAQLITTAVWLASACCNLALGQTARPTVMTIDIDNYVEYQADISDVSKFATNPSVTPSAGFRNFGDATLLGDIVAVNGQPAKGLYAARSPHILTSQDPGNGRAIADTQHNSIRTEVYEILKSEGDLVGTIVVLGLPGNTVPPGSPSAQTSWDLVIVGGSGAFFGVRGAGGIGARDGSSARLASVAEDPGNRRVNGGGTHRRVLTIIPMSAPQIVTTANGPAVAHFGDSSPVNASKPASAGERLSLIATGLGPVKPGVDPGQPFPSDPPAAVNSPVQVTVNGQTAEVLEAIGYPGSVDTYQVTFRLPADIAAGTATVQVSAAWIAGPPVGIAVQ